MNLAPPCPAGDPCPSPATPPPCPTSVLMIRVRASARSALQTLDLRASREEADDLVQETLLRLWTRYPQRWGRYPRRLTNRVALRILVDRLRFATAKKRDRRRVVSLETAAEVSPAEVSLDDALAAREDLAERLRFCRDVLSADHWRAFVALFVLGLTSREAAARFGCKSSTLDVRAVRIRKVLAERGMSLPRRPRGGRS